MYCSKCGCEINENATFCGNCGNQIKKNIKSIKKFDLSKIFKKILNFDLENILNKTKKYFSNFCVDYNSKCFKFAILIFLAIGIGEPLYTLISLLKFDMSELFIGASDVFNFVVCIGLFGIFIIPILKLKNKKIIKKSNFIRVFWIVSLVLNILVFLAGMSISQYIVYPNIVVPIVKILTVVSSVLLLYKNKPKYPIALVLTVLSFALSNSSMWIIKVDVSLYKIWKTWDYLIKIFDIASLGYILLVLTLFVLVYIFPRKISKWLVYIPSFLLITLNIIDLVKYFSFVGIIYFIMDICLIILVILFSLSCSREIEYEYVVQDLDKTKRSAVKVGIISISTITGIVLTYLLASAIICSMQINSGISKWKTQIISATLNSSSQWSSVSEDVFKFTATKFASQFIDEYNLYETLKTNKNTMEEISICHSAYQYGTVNSDIIEKYSKINVDESWANDSILSAYYNKYLEMQPDIGNVFVDAMVDVDEGKIEVKVSNKNKMPISKCTVECKFTILFVKAGYYSSNEYGRGTKTITVKDIAGNSEKTETIFFDPDDYYNSYSSYIAAFLRDKSARVISISIE